MSLDLPGLGGGPKGLGGGLGGFSPINLRLPPRGGGGGALQVLAWWTIEDALALNGPGTTTGNTDKWIDRVGNRVLSAGTTYTPILQASHADGKGGFMNNYQGGWYNYVDPHRLPIDREFWIFQICEIVGLPTSGNMNSGAWGFGLGGDHYAGMAAEISFNAQAEARAKFGSMTPSVVSWAQVAGWELWAVRFSPTGIEQWRNGSLISAAQAGPMTPINTIGFKVGAPMGGDYVIPHYRDIMATGPLTTTQRQRVEGYLAWLHGDASSLPLHHPFRNSSPGLIL